MEPVLWSIKYQPQNWDEFVGQEAALNRLKSLAESKNLPHLLLLGPSGTGKTLSSLVYARTALGDDFGANFKMLNVRDLRDYSLTDAKRNIQSLSKIDREKRSEFDEYMSIVYREVTAALKAKGITRPPNRSQLLHQAIRMFASTATLSSTQVKILVLDEADALDNNMLQALRRTMEIYADICRFVLITQSISGWNPAIVSRCVVVPFLAANDDDIRSLLLRVCGEESVEIDDYGLKAIIRESSGDMRKALNLLQLCAASGKPITEDLVFAFSDTPLSSGVRSMVSDAISGNYLKARDKLRQLLTSENYSPRDILVQIQREIGNRPLEPSRLKHILDRIAEIDYRTTQGKNPHIHLTALLASISNIVEPSV